MENKKRKPNRLNDYDYSKNGAYFITICTKDRMPILSEITVGADIIGPQIKLTHYGEIAKKSIEAIPLHYNGVFVDNFVIMPNHIHLIIRLNGEGGPMVSAPTIVGSFKRHVSKQIGKGIWQKNFYDHIIRDEADYMMKYQYIDENPIKWAEDKYYI